MSRSSASNVKRPSGGAVKLPTIGRRWGTYQHQEIARLRAPEIGLVGAMLRTGRTPGLGPAEATSLIDRTRVSQVSAIDQAPVQDQLPDRDRPRVRDHRHAMCRTFLICRMPEVEMSAETDHLAESATRLKLLVAL